MNCLETKNKLPDYITNELSFEDYKMVDYHLSTCAKCREKKDEIAIIIGALSKCKAPQLSEKFEENVIARIKKLDNAKKFTFYEWLSQKYYDFNQLMNYRISVWDRQLSPVPVTLLVLLFFLPGLYIYMSSHNQVSVSGDATHSNIFNIFPVASTRGIDKSIDNEKHLYKIEVNFYHDGYIYLILQKINMDIEIILSEFKITGKKTYLLPENTETFSFDPKQYINIFLIVSHKKPTNLTPIINSLKNKNDDEIKSFPGVSILRKSLKKSSNVPSS